MSVCRCPVCEKYIDSDFVDIGQCKKCKDVVCFDCMDDNDICFDCLEKEN